MNKRIWEFFFVLAAVALMVVLFWRPARAPEPSPSKETPPPTVGTPRPEPTTSTVVYTHAAKEDFMNAKGMAGWEETLQTPIPEPSPERLKKGAKLYQDNCALCHGSVGKGDGEAATVLDPRPTDLTRIKNYKYGHMELGVFRSSKYGIEGTGMAPWDGILSNDELWNITQYVRFLQED
jgi:cbb3-type cytochrome c oxidase subunit III